MPSTRIVTTSPGVSGGGSRLPARPQSSAKAAAAACPRPEHVAGADPRAPRGVGDEVLERPGHAREPVGADALAVQEDLELEVEPVAPSIRLELVGGHEPGPEGDGGVLSLRRPEADLHLLELEVARRPVVEDRVGDDVVARLGGCQVAAVAADHRGDFELVVEDLAAGRDCDVVVRADEGVGVREVERRRLVPARVHLARRLVEAHHPLDVLLERQEVADRRWVERRKQRSRSERQRLGGRLRPIRVAEQVEDVRLLRKQPELVPLDESDARTRLRRDPSDPHIGAAVTWTDFIVSPTKSASGGGVCSISHVPICREISQISRQRG